MATKNKQAEDFKEKGNQEFGAGNYEAAIQLYTKAIEVDAKNHIYYSNRAACYHALNQYEQAGEDGRRCIEVKPNWAKGYFRVGLAYMFQRKYDDAISWFKKGLAVEPKNADLKVHLEECEKLKASYKVRLNADGTPMSPAQNAKEEGNENFKKSQYELAIESYTQAIGCATGEDGNEFLASVYNNRAACHSQLHHHKKVAEDTSKSLELQPNNVKALTRRALALEALEKYKDALADVEKALLIEPSNSPAQQCANRIRGALRKMNQ
jgi:stress-induced-phosphoprotein 1